MAGIITADFTQSWLSFTATLDGADYRFEFAWNTRAARWFLSIAAADGTPLVSGVAVVVDYPLLSRYVADGVPPGVLMAVDMSGSGEEIIEQEDLGTRVQLMYLSADEVASG